MRALISHYTDLRFKMLCDDDDDGGGGGSRAVFYNSNSSNNNNTCSDTTSGSSSCGGGSSGSIIESSSICNHCSNAYATSSIDLFCSQDCFLEFGGSSLSSICNSSSNSRNSSGGGGGNDDKNSGNYIGYLEVSTVAKYLLLVFKYPYRGFFRENATLMRQLANTISLIANDEEFRCMLGVDCISEKFGFQFYVDPNRESQEGRMFARCNVCLTELSSSPILTCGNRNPFSNWPNHLVGRYHRTKLFNEIENAHMDIGNELVERTLSPYAEEILDDNNDASYELSSYFPKVAQKHSSSHERACGTSVFQDLRSRFPDCFIRRNEDDIYKELHVYDRDVYLQILLTKKFVKNITSA